MGGSLVGAASGGQNATAGILTVGVPAPGWEEALAEIRQLGPRVEPARFGDAQATYSQPPQSRFGPLVWDGKP